MGALHTPRPLWFLASYQGPDPEGKFFLVFYSRRFEFIDTDLTGLLRGVMERLRQGRFEFSDTGDLTEALRGLLDQPQSAVFRLVGFTDTIGSFDASIEPSYSPKKKKINNGSAEPKRKSGYGLSSPLDRWASLSASIRRCPKAPTTRPYGEAPGACFTASVA